MMGAGTMWRRMGLVTLGLAALVATAADFPSIEIHGQDYPSACGTAGWAELEGALRTRAEGRRPQQLVDLVRTYLCDEGPQADQRLQRWVARYVRVTSEETGIVGQSHSRMERASVQALGGRAWSAGVEAEDGQVWVSFAPNEACARSTGFRHGRRGWTLYALSEACD